MNRVFKKFTITLLLLTAITGVMFIGCNDDEEDKRYSPQNTETSIPNWEDSTVTEYNYKTIPLNYYLAGIWDEVSLGHWNTENENFEPDEPSLSSDTSVLIFSTETFIALCGNNINKRYSINLEKDEFYLYLEENGNGIPFPLVRISENEMIWTPGEPCNFNLNVLVDVKYRRSGK